MWGGEVGVGFVVGFVEGFVGVRLVGQYEDCLGVWGLWLCGLWLDMWMGGLWGWCGVSGWIVEGCGCGGTVEVKGTAQEGWTHPRTASPQHQQQWVSGVHSSLLAEPLPTPP